MVLVYWNRIVVQAKLIQFRPQEVLQHIPSAAGLTRTTYTPYTDYYNTSCPEFVPHRYLSSSKQVLLNTMRTFVNQSGILLSLHESNQKGIRLYWETNFWYKAKTTCATGLRVNQQKRTVLRLVCSVALQRWQNLRRPNTEAPHTNSCIVEQTQIAGETLKCSDSIIQ